MKSSYFLWKDERMDIQSMFLDRKTRYIKNLKTVVDKYYEDGVRRTDVYKLEPVKVFPTLIRYRVTELRSYKLGIDGYEKLVEPYIGAISPYDGERTVFINEE